VDEETVSDSDLDMLRASGVNHVLLTEFNRQINGVWQTGWQASIGRRKSSGYTVVQDRSPALALFRALQQAGITDGPSWDHPNPLQRLGNALDRAIIARGQLSA